MRTKTYAVIIFLLTLVGIGGFFIAKKFKRDRQAAMVYEPAKQPNREQKKNTDQTHTPSQAAQANEAAVQRSLRTIEEINRINAMNQRLIDQQQRQQRQNR